MVRAAAFRRNALSLEKAFSIGLKSGDAVHRPVEDHGRGHAVDAERAREGRGLPMPVRHRGAAALSYQRATSQPGHLGRGAGFVDEDQAP